MNHRITRLLFAAALAVPLAVRAADPAGMAEGEVRKVDAANGKLTLKHGEIKDLDMPPMTMVFVVKDKSTLDKLKAGDKVRFKAAKEGTAFVVIEIEAAR
jgi:Cu/Ag efflux protein CusF